MKTAVVTGITGQDGSYLAELLLEKGYTVIGCYRRNSNNNFQRIEHLQNNEKFILEEFDLTDPASCNRIIEKYQPDELYNLAAQSHVGTSFKQPTLTFDINTGGVVNLLEAIRQFSPSTKMYQASTSEMFGRNYSINGVNNKFQDEETELMPQSPYGVAKTAAHQLMTVYRLSYGLYTCCGILFNHESPRRGENFVTRKITKWIGEYTKWRESLPDLDNLVIVNEDDSDTIQCWNIDSPTEEDQRMISEFPKLKLGNLDAERDWGHAKDYVRAMWLMMQQTEPQDYVICTSATRSVHDFLEIAFKYAGLSVDNLVKIDSDLFRPAEVDFLRGNFTKAKNNLGWQPMISFEELVHEMVDYDIKRLQRSSVQKLETASL